MPEAAKVIAGRVIISKPKSTSIPVGYIVIMFSTCLEKYVDKCSMSSYFSNTLHFRIFCIVIKTVDLKKQSFCFAFSPNGP
jgi:hypothetical protein